ncbi:hypothetical protein COV20_02445 [Candidatus Woesearchaeota archaeon CG10_big_fil_rev_8_21_14_0_10_45_16]|nr:MAG: hypothetical protein COV20_02445 [Candidatus Woesearchaeota archaeon CG10_big_fil_rev_8_21_14_0_10_45_16]
MNIYPSVMGKSQKEIDLLFSKLKGTAEVLHLDVADGRFVPNKSLWFPFKLSSSFRYNAHLMVEKPLEWVEKQGRKVDLVIIHPEVGDISKVISLLRKEKKRVGIALKPETSVVSVKKYLTLVDYVLVLTVHPGFYGAKYLKAPLRKIRQIKKINPKVKVIVDGHMNPETVKDAVKAGADDIVSGSFVSRSDDPKKAMKELRKAVGTAKTQR